MSSRKNRGKKLPTDKSTDMMIDFYVNEEKFNEAMKPEYETMKKKLDKKQSSTKKENSIPSIPSKSSLSSQELPSNNSDENYEFDDSSESESSSNNSSTESNSSNNSMYAEKIETKSVKKSEKKIDVKSEKKIDVKSEKKIDVKSEKKIDKSESENRNDEPRRPLLAENLIGNLEEYRETPEEKRARSRDAYYELQDLVEKYNIKPSKPYTIDSDPDEIETEIKMHKERRHKSNQVKFYKGMLINIVSGIEFMNEKYDPFEFKLKDWSKQIAMDVDDYTEVLEELYEKYKDRGGKFSPELRLLFMIILSGVTFHISQTLFGINGTNDAIKKNPNVINKLLSGLMNGGLNRESNEVKNIPSNSKDLLKSIKQHNKTSEDNITEREKKLLTKQQDIHIEQLRKQNEMFRTQFEQMQKQQNHIEQVNNIIPNDIKSNLKPINQVLSSKTQAPLFEKDNDVKTQAFLFEKENDIKSQNNFMMSNSPKNTGSEGKMSKSLTNKMNKNEYTNLYDSLETIDAEDIISTSITNIKNIGSAKKTPKSNNSVKSTNIRKKTNSLSDITKSISKKGNVIRI